MWPTRGTSTRQMVEACGEACQFVAAAHRYACVKVARAEFVGGRLESLKRHHQPPRHEHHRQQRDQHACHAEADQQQHCGVDQRDDPLRPREFVKKFISFCEVNDAGVIACYYITGRNFRLSTPHLSFPMNSPAIASLPSRRLWLLLLLICLGSAAAVAWHFSHTNVTPLMDLTPLYYGAQAWLHSGNAYDLSLTTPPEIRNLFVIVAGSGYPFPAILLVLPLSLLPVNVAAALWLAGFVAAVIVALWLNRAPPWLILYFPLIEAFVLHQYMLLLFVVSLVALWAYKQERPWLLALCCALMLTKPTFSAVPALALAVLARNWRQQAAMMALVWGGATLLDPGWPLEYLASLRTYIAMAAQGPDVLWPVILLVPLLFALGDPLSAAVVTQVALTPFTSIYNTALLPLSHVSDRRSLLITLCALIYSPLSIIADRPIAVAVSFVLPVVALSLLRRFSPGDVALGAKVV